MADVRGMMADVLVTLEDVTSVNLVLHIIKATFIVYHLFSFSLLYPRFRHSVAFAPQSLSLPTQAVQPLKRQHRLPFLPTLIQQRSKLLY